MAINNPFASQEVRWFFDGKSERHPLLRQWFETAAPIEKSADAGSPAWRGRLDDQPDIYLIIPGSEDMGIKWREGEFQVKGRVATLGTQVYAGRHRGRVERWVKWSYPGMPEAYRNLFLNASGQDLLSVEVHKVRALRKIRLDTMTNKAQEVAATIPIDRGLGFELTDLQADGVDYCSLAVEAFPDDSAMGAAFAATVGAFLQTLTDLDLGPERSMSYPAWLNLKFNG